MGTTTGETEGLSRFRRLLLGGAILIVIIVVIGATALSLRKQDDGAPLPSQSSLQTYGFAVWPVDTPEEGVAECDGAEEWRRDPDETARRFAAEVLNYPSPEVADTEPVDDHVRYLINSRQMRGLSLGSVLDLRRYGLCWYVVGGQPREEELVATLAFVQRDGRPHLVLSDQSRIPHTHIGFGSWDTTVITDRKQVTIALPDDAMGSPGHVLFTAPDKLNISEQVGADTLGPIPGSDLGVRGRRLSPQEIVDIPKVCRPGYTAQSSGKAVIRDLYMWPFRALLEVVDGYPYYERRRFESVSRDRWRLMVDDAELLAVVPQIAGRCYKLVSLVPDEGSVIRSLRIAARTVTFDIEWGDADSASIQFGTSFGRGGGTIRRIDGPITFQSQGLPQARDGPHVRAGRALQGRARRVRRVRPLRPEVALEEGDEPPTWWGRRG